MLVLLGLVELVPLSSAELVPPVSGEPVPPAVEDVDEVDEGATVVAVEPLDAARPGAALATTAAKAPARAMEPQAIQRVAVLTRRRP